MERNFSARLGQIEAGLAMIVASMESTFALDRGIKLMLRIALQLMVSQLIAII
jgi:hypothetical protein